MKKIVAVLLIAALLCALMVGCGKTMAQKTVEKKIEEATNGKVELDDDKITFEGDDGAKAEIGAGKWPDSDLVKKLPVFKECNVVSSVQANDVVMITLDQIDREAFAGYLEQLKTIFSENALDGTFNGLLTYVGHDKDGFGVSVYYSEEAGEAVINAGKDMQ